MRCLCFSITITATVLGNPHLGAQQVTNAAPLSQTSADALPEAPQSSAYPELHVIHSSAPGDKVAIESDDPQTIVGGHWTASGNVIVTYKDRTLHADRIDYDRDTGDVTLTGHLLVTGGQNHEEIRATHGVVNVTTETATFYDVTGSVGLRQAVGVKTPAVYANTNPFLFTGKVVVKTGPREYVIYQGTVTSCQLPKPDWLLSAAKFTVDEDADQARASNSVFHLLSLPIVWLPYVTHPVDAQGRQSGILIPVVGDSSSKGLTFGEQLYWAINRSTDLTVGTIYYSDRGWAQTARFQYRGTGQNLVHARYSGLQDRGYTPSGGTYTNQSGVDIVLSARRDLSTDDQSTYPQRGAGAINAQVDGQTRGVADIEYLSSFIYREAFTDNFNQAVSSDVNSIMFGTHEWNGFAASIEGDRYQGEKRVATTLLPEQQVHIFHAPSLEFTTTDHRLGSTGIEWSLDSSATALKRIQPNFVTSGMIERTDVHPEVAYPLNLGAWRVRPAVAARDTFYSRSRLPGVGLPVESTATLNRADVEVQVDVRPPVLERTFDSGFLRKLLGHDVKHTIEPDITYHFVSGISNFQNVLRFDTVDVASNTNEVQYGATQRLFLRRTGTSPCHAPGDAASADEVLGPTQAQDEAEPKIVDPESADALEPVCGNREWISWTVAQKYFFDPFFGGAIAAGRRNILSTTLDFSGIAFLTEPRNISPLISRLRVRTSEKTDLEWDFDLDTGAKKFTANNIFVDVHQGNTFAGLSYARLNAPGRSYVEGVASSVADFSQLRLKLGYGNPSRAGFSVSTITGLDLNLATVQYGTVQTSYNWNCCGLSVEYRKYELGTARNENAYRFNFTLANIGSAGNLRRTQQLF